jgi:hypothetical protein
MFLFNAFVCFNLSVEERRRRGERNINKLQHHQVLTYIAQCMLDYKDVLANPPTPEFVCNQKLVADSIAEAKHKTLVADNTKKINKARYLVCRLESSLSGGKVGEAGIKRNLCRCSECHVTVHNHIIDDPTRKLHGMECFKGMTCFEIMHVPKEHEGHGLWMTKLQRGHPIYKELRRQYGLTGNIKRPRCVGGGNSINDNNIDNND